MNASVRAIDLLRAIRDSPAAARTMRPETNIDTGNRKRVSMMLVNRWTCGVVRAHGDSLDHGVMTNIMLSTDELMTVYRALERAAAAAAEEAKAKGQDPEASREYVRNKRLLEKVEQVTR